MPAPGARNAKGASPGPTAPSDSPHLIRALLAGRARDDPETRTSTPNLDLDPNLDREAPKARVLIPESNRAEKAKRRVHREPASVGRPPKANLACQTPPAAAGPIPRRAGRP